MSTKPTHKLEVNPSKSSNHQDSSSCLSASSPILISNVHSSKHDDDDDNLQTTTNTRNDINIVYVDSFSKNNDDNVHLSSRSIVNQNRLQQQSIHQNKDNVLIEQDFLLSTTNTCDNNNNTEALINIPKSTALLFNNQNHNKTSHLELENQQKQIEKTQDSCSKDKNEPSSSASSLPPQPSSSIKTDSSSIPGQQTSEIELISLLNQPSGPIPHYKLRVDNVTKFTGYPNNDWLIETPLIDLEAPIDLNPALIRETLNLFIQSGKRLTQMTKVYDDVEALTKLLEEKERDVELAARIGQSLLDQNQQQTERIDELECELTRAKDKITQLKHEVLSKSDLLKFYINKDEEENDDDHKNNSFNDDELNLTSVSSLPSFSKDASQILDELDRRVQSLEEENNRLKNEKESKINNLEDEERKELQLINECARRLSQTNKQIASLQEELTKKTDENNRLSKELCHLKQQVNSLEKQIRKLTIEKEELVGALNIAHECQSELTIELIDVKEKHTNLLGAFHEKQEECRQLREQQFNDHIFSYVDSLAYELDNSFHSCQLCDENASSNDDGHLNHHHHHATNHHQNNGNSCFTPDSLLSSDSFYTSSPYSSIVVTSSIQPQSPSSVVEDSLSKSSTSLPQPSTTTCAVPKNISPIIEHNSSSSASSTATTITITNDVPSKIGTTITTLAKPHLSHHHHHRGLFLTDKLRYIKPLEGSQILNHWRRLANPNLNDLFEDKDRYVSRIKANLVAAEVCSEFMQTKDDNLDQKHNQENKTKSSYSNNFVTTNSVFTFTTTSLSHMKETMTEVTTTFSDVQPSTGQNDYSIYKHLPSKKPSVSTGTTKMFNNPTSLAQMHNRISLVEQVKNIIKVDQLPMTSPSSASPTFPNSTTKRMEPKKDSQIDPLSVNNTDKGINDDKDRVDGLNELAKLLSLNASNTNFKTKTNLDQRKQTQQSASQPSLSNNVFLTNGISGVGGGSRIFTKIQMANNNSYKLGAIKKPLWKTGDNNNNDNDGEDQKPSMSRTNLSVLRNLRKGGLI